VDLFRIIPTISGTSIAADATRFTVASCPDHPAIQFPLPLQASLERLIGSPNFKFSF
jgi:hypothetical protein